MLAPRIRMRRARVDDAEASFKWFSNAAVTEYLPLAGEKNLPMEDIVAHLRAADRDDCSDLSLTIELLSGRVIGCGGLRAITHDSGEVSVVIGEPDLWGQGYALEAMTLLLQFAFDALRLQTVWLIVRADNARALRLFAHLGFVTVDAFSARVGSRGLERTKHRMELGEASWRRRSGVDA